MNKIFTWGSKNYEENEYGLDLDLLIIWKCPI